VVVEVEPGVVVVVDEGSGVIIVAITFSHRTTNKGTLL